MKLSPSHALVLVLSTGCVSGDKTIQKDKEPSFVYDLKKIACERRFPSGHTLDTNATCTSWIKENGHSVFVDYHALRSIGSQKGGICISIIPPSSNNGGHDILCTDLEGAFHDEWRNPAWLRPSLNPVPNPPPRDRNAAEQRFHEYSAAIMIRYAQGETQQLRKLLMQR